MKYAVIYFGFNNPHGHKRGVENVIEVQAQALPAHSRKYYLFFDARPSVTRWGDIISIGIKFGPLRFIITNIIVATLLHRLRRSDFDVILHSHNYLISLFLLWKSDLFSVHDGLWYQMKSVGRRSLLFWGVERIVYRRSKNLHCNSRFTYENSLLPKAGKPVHIIYCSTPLERRRSEGLQNPLRLTSKDTSMVFSVRSIEPRARIDLVIEAAERARDRQLPLSFFVAGKGPLLQYYRDEISRRGLTNIKLLGYVGDSELARLYAGCDCVLMMCEYGEGFGIPIIEGYLFGKAVLGSNRCAVPEILICQDHLVENDPDDVLRHLVALHISPAGSEKVESYYDQTFSNAVITTEFQVLYDAIFSPSRPVVATP
jgi:glycosyltransferase involved in cell wall biosynthesis